MRVPPAEGASEARADVNERKTSLEIVSIIISGPCWVLRRGGGHKSGEGEFWFRWFKNGEFNMEDKECQGRPENFKGVELENILEDDSCQIQENL
ncbi:hypothetical protein J6590_047332 [Homalodisca vitripennis]|nr:hypothetical protein J6590_047332 [Homalodisca vitripennis]